MRDSTGQLSTGLSSRLSRRVYNCDCFKIVKRKKKTPIFIILEDVGRDFLLEKAGR